jgi:hypothetical protein
MCADSVGKSGDCAATFPMNPDFLDLLRAFAAADVRFLIVRAYALALHGRPRATGDLDIWIDATRDNARRVMRALGEFGAPLAEIAEADFIGRASFVRNKWATGRPKDLEDIQGME